jgi:membrane protein implicated in regulation of membrane protease activity
MGPVYLFALALSLGLLVLQIAMGAGGHGAGGDHDLGGHDAGHPDPAHDHGAHAEPGALALLLSTRFWIFFALASGLSGSLLHYLDLAGPTLTAAIAAGAGIAAGLFAALAFRAARRATTGAAASTTEAVGRTGRVLVACAPGKVGQVRIELGGHSVDLLATTDDDELARGEAILIEEVERGVARVSRRPAELE